MHRLADLPGEAQKTIIKAIKLLMAMITLVEQLDPAFLTSRFRWLYSF